MRKRNGGFIAGWIKGSFRFLIVCCLLLAMVLTACTPTGQGTPAAGPGENNPTSNPGSTNPSPSPTLPPELPVKVVSQAMVPDMQGNLHVAGEVRNESGQNATDILLTLVAQDAGGVSVFKNEAGESLPEITFAPLVADLANGQTAPFDYALPAGVSAPPLVQVFVSGFTPLAAELLTLQVEHAQVMTGPGGEAVLVGELVNQNAVAVDVGGAAAVLRNSENDPISAGKAGVLPGMLQPAGDSLNQDRAPFKIPLYASLPEGATWQVYTSAVQTDPVDTSLFAIDQAVNIYADSRGVLHMVSNVRNNAERAFSVQILAALYSSTASVLDDSLAALPVDLAAGEELPFEITGFTLLDGNTDQQSKLGEYTLQVDAFRTVPSDLVWSKLSPEGDQAQDQGQGVWKFSGSVTNTTAGDLQRIVVVAILKSSITGAVTAVSSAALVNPAGMIAPGVHMDYAVEVWSDPASPENLKPDILVFGAGG